MLTLQKVEFILRPMIHCDLGSTQPLVGEVLAGKIERIEFQRWFHQVGGVRPRFYPEVGPGTPIYYIEEKNPEGGRKPIVMPDSGPRYQSGNKQ